jgi:predicted ATPase
MLKSIRVQHFKSLQDVTVEFSPITILVGPNGSGKSNVVDALRFMRDAIVHGLDHAVSERSGLDVLLQYSPRRPYILSMEAQFEYTIDQDAKSYPARYAFRVAGKGGNYKVESEEASWFSGGVYYGEDGSESDYVIENKFRRDKAGAIFSDDKKIDFEAASDQLVVKQFRLRDRIDVQPLIDELATLRFSAIYPNVLRSPSRPDTDKILKEDCANWASVLKAMRHRKIGEQMLGRITEYMRHVLPGLEHVSVKLIGGYLVPQFLVKDTPMATAHHFDPVQLSDGTLRLFAILLTLYQTPHPEFLALEEPELTIHPGLIGLLAEAFNEISERTQLLVTTHSPHMLDYFDPDQIRVVDMKEGETSVSKIRHSQVEAVRKKLMTLSEVMTLDGLRPSEQ